MSIEDINYLKNNSIKQSYTFLIDSKDRDRNVYPHPNYYVVDFTVPFKNVIGLEVIDASVPRTMYNVDVNNNTLYIYIATSQNDINYRFGFTDYVAHNGINVPYTDLFQKITLEPGDYTSTTFISTFNNIMRNKNIDVNIKAYSNPPELSNLIQFYSASYGFVLDMKRSTLFEILGFDLYINAEEGNKPNNDRKYTYIDNYQGKENFQRMYHSVFNSTSQQYIVTSPGIIYFMGHKYVILRCPEIEEHLYRSLSYSKYNLGLAKFRISSFGYNDERIVITKLPIREFHPIGKLSRLTFRFETSDGKLYDFKGVNHNIVYAIYYYEPIQKHVHSNSILNPEYKMNYLDYMYKQEEIEGDSDEDDDENNEDEYSRDDIELYKNKELKYSTQGLNLSKLDILDN
jgi:hypothetical protein